MDDVLNRLSAIQSRYGTDQERNRIQTLFILLNNCLCLINQIRKNVTFFVVHLFTLLVLSSTRTLLLVSSTPNTNWFFFRFFFYRFICFLLRI